MAALPSPATPGIDTFELEDGVESQDALSEPGRGISSFDRTRPAYFSWLRLVRAA